MLHRREKAALRLRVAQEMSGLVLVRRLAMMPSMALMVLLVLGLEQRCWLLVCCVLWRIALLVLLLLLLLLRVRRVGGGVRATLVLRGLVLAHRLLLSVGEARARDPPSALGIVDLSK